MARALLTRLRAAGAKALSDLRHAHDTQLSEPVSLLPLLEFAAEPALARWRLATDADYGGFSECRLSPGSSSSSLLWSGHTRVGADSERQSEVVNDKGRVASNTGFCGMRVRVEEEGWRLHDFHGLQVRMRPDARHYILNVRADSVLGDSRLDDLYQAPLRPYIAASVAAARGADLGSAAMADVRVPWGAFTLTWRGYLQGDRPPPMNLDRITHMGFLVRTGEADAPFECEFERISAFRYSEHEMIHDPHARAALALNAELGYDDIVSG
jgi:hypothetical protein